MRTFDVPLPVDLGTSLQPLVGAAGDPTIRVRPTRVVRAGSTPAGPVCLDLHRTGERRFLATAAGPGAAWALEAAPALVGGADDLDGFVPENDPMVLRAHRRRPDLRVVRWPRVWDVVVPTILGQRVTTREAGRSWTRIVRSWGTQAPSWPGLYVPPSPEVLASQSTWAYHRLGVERARADRIRRVARDLVERSEGDGQEDAARTLERLSRLPGVGPWTTALVARSALGDPDAVEVGDLHVPHQVTYALTGRPRGSDDEMLALLAPFAGHRGRVVRLLTTSVRRPPRYGPRQRIVPIDAW